MVDAKISDLATTFDALRVPDELPGSQSEGQAAIPPHTKSIAQFSSPTTQYQKHTLLCKIESSYQILRTGQRATDKTRKVLTGTKM